MSSVEIRLFEGFRVIADGRELPLSPSVKETLALLTAAGGKKVTAKALWKVLYDYKKVGYNSVLYTRRINELKSELEAFKISGIVYSGTKNVRFCRIVQEAVVCDYFEMLSGSLPIGRESDFLPEYEWAKNFYHNDRSSLYQYWDDLKC